MKAVVFDGYGAAEVMRWDEAPEPVPGPGELLVAVRAAGVNRADVIQRRGHYPPPPGASQILGLELAGEVVALGPGCRRFKVGDRIFGLVEGGAYAERCAVNEALAIATPPHWTDAFAAAVLEVFLTANETLCHLGDLRAGQEVLIHAGGSGVGSTAIQMARLIGARIATTAGSAWKTARCLEIGADLAIDYKTQVFSDAVRQWSRAGGVHLILDFVGAAYLDQHLELLRPQGRLVSIGLLGGHTAPLRLDLVLRKRLHILGSVLRILSLEEKVDVMQRFQLRWMDALLKNAINPIIHKNFPVEKVVDAHKMMEAGNHFGKIVLTI